MGRGHLTGTELLAVEAGAMSRRELDEAEEHIAFCDRCLSEYYRLKDMGEAIGRAGTMPERGVTCPDDEDISALAEGRLGRDRAEEVRVHVLACGSCMSSAVFAYRATREMEGGVAERTPQWLKGEAIRRLGAEEPKAEARNRAGEGELRERSGFRARVITGIRHLNSALPSLPAYAAAAVLIAVLAGYIFTPGEFMLIGRPVLTVVEDGGMNGSFAFMGGAVTENLPEDWMSVSVSGRQLEFEWWEIPGVELYSFTLKRRVDGADAEVLSATTGERLVRVPLSRLAERELYRWEVSGRTADGANYSASSGVLRVR